MKGQAGINQDLHLALLGRPIINLGGVSLRERDVIPLKMQALVCYLVLNPGEHEREKLASLLWGESTTQQSRTSLRTDLARTAGRLNGFLHIKRSSLAFNQTTSYWLDVEAFSQQLTGKPTAEQLRRAVALYRGEFLEGFFINNAPDFDDWLVGQRERLREMALQALAQLVNVSLTQKGYQEGIAYAKQLLRLDPWREEAHRDLMRLLALSDQRSAALEQFEKCRDILAVEFGVEPGLETVRLAEQIKQDLLRPQPAPIPITHPAPFQPPPDLPHFVNREILLAQIKAAITAQPGRFAVIGMGGMGKTSFVIHLAHQIRDQFPDGVLWADVRHDDPIGLIDRWAEAYGCDFRAVADEASRAAALRDILKDKKALLILDDVDFVTRVRPLLPEKFPGTILFTTRDEDVAFHLKATRFRLEELNSADGLTLLRQVVGDERVERELAAAHQLCTLLQNLPLALTIAAQRLALRHQMHLRDMVARLQREKSRLSALDEQGQAVRASFLVSWRALDEKQKRTFALIGIFAGRSFTVAALTASAGGDPYETEDHLFALNALSLVALAADNRYRQHSLLAEFAREHLADTEAEQRLATYYLTFAQENGQDYDALRPEWENLMAGMKLAHEREMWAEVLGYSEALTEAWFARGRYTEARQGYEWAVAAAEAIYNPLKQANTLLHWGRACLEQGDNSIAQTKLTYSIHIYKQQQEPSGIARVQNLLARALTEQIRGKSGKDEIMDLLDSSQSLYSTLGDELGESEAIHLKAHTLFLAENYKEAQQLALLALRKREGINDTRGLIATLRLLSRISRSPILQENVNSTRYCLRALSLSETLQDKGELAVSLSMTAGTLNEDGRLHEALIMLNKAIPILRQIGTRRNLATALHRLAIIQKGLGNLPEAIRIAEESLAICQTLREPLFLLNILVDLGDLYIAHNRLDQARIIFQHGLNQATQINHPGWLNSFQTRLDRLDASGDR
jgi:DNA-binding SARP family transcriptional activator